MKTKMPKALDDPWDSCFLNAGLLDDPWDSCFLNAGLLDGPSEEILTN